MQRRAQALLQERVQDGIIPPGWKGLVSLVNTLADAACLNGSSKEELLERTVIQTAISLSGPEEQRLPPSLARKPITHCYYPLPIAITYFPTLRKP